MTDNDTGFAPGQRVYHRGRREFGIFCDESWADGESVVEFPDDVACRVTTAQLVAADEVEENA